MEKFGNVWHPKQVEIPPLNQNCKLTIIIPVHGEPIDEVLSLVKDLTQQRNLTPDIFELVLAVNSDKSSQDDEKQTKNHVLYNSQTIETIKENTGAKIHLLDCFSSKNYLTDCNVGMARDIAAKIVCQRYNRKRGVLVFIDADCRVPNPYLIDSILTTYCSDPGIIGIAGGLKYILKSDVSPEVDKKLRDRFSKLCLS